MIIRMESKGLIHVPNTTEYEITVERNDDNLYNLMMKTPSSNYALISDIGEAVEDEEYASIIANLLLRFLCEAVANTYTETYAVIDIGDIYQRCKHYLNGILNSIDNEEGDE